MPKHIRHPKPAKFKPASTFPKGHQYAGKPRCQAWNENHARQCSKIPMKVLAGGHPADPNNYSTVCEFDGGKSPRGMEHYNYQGKGYSRFTPGALEPTITAFLQHGYPLDLIQAIGTWEGRIGTLLQTLDQGGAPARLLGELRRELEGLWTAIDANQTERALEHRRAIEQLLGSSQAQADTWEQLENAEQIRTKLIETEDKKRERARGYVRDEQLRFAFNGLRLAVVEGVQLIEDPQLQRKVRTAIAERFIQIVGPAALPGPAAAGRAD
jgi:hypothetical protein